MTKRKKKRREAPVGRPDPYPSAPMDPAARKAWMDARSAGIGERGAAAAADAVDGGTIGHGSKGTTS
jgi:hypothetical protein